MVRITKAKKQNVIMKIVLAPIKVLCKATDFYTRSMDDCAGRVGNGGVMACCPAGQVQSRLPKSFSVSSASRDSDDEEFRELLRAAASRSGNEVQLQMHQQLKRKRARAVVEPTGMQGIRSYSFGIGKIGRIDEDKQCTFEEEDCATDLLCPRSRSTCAVKRDPVELN